MITQHKIMPYLLGVFLLTTSIAFAQDEDVEGSKDHPLISRYSGSIIEYYEAKEFDEYVLPLGGLVKGRLSKSQRLEGKVIRITYAVPKGRSTLEVYRNYELALKKTGFEILFAIAGEELGDSYNWVRYFYESLNPLRRGARDRLIDGASYQRYLSAKLSRPEGDVYVSLYVPLSWLGKCPAVQLDVIEVKPMEIGLVAVNADALAKDIARTGHVAVYGIYFDTGKADIKPESEPTLKEIAKLLQQNPKLKLYVVGHTDNVGPLTYNMDLSQRRAEAVANILVSKYNIDAKRLHAVGVGFLAPVASNKTEEGRAKNRRVELVEE